MGDKYIIELEDKPFHKGNGDFLYRVKGFNSLVFDMTGIGMLTPYTEPDIEQAKDEAYNEGYKAGREAEKVRQPDLEQVRKEAYEKGFDDGRNKCQSREYCMNESYQRGLADAWKTARKIVTMPDRDFINSDILDLDPGESIFSKFTASEAIEKIRQYEQEQEEIKVGDEVENTQTGVKFIVTHLWENNRGEQGVSGFNQECSAFSTTLSMVVKTGRSFPEIAAVLEKMRGENND